MELWSGSQRPTRLPGLQASAHNDFLVPVPGLPGAREHRYDSMCATVLPESGPSTSTQRRQV
jgi:hypothetical protein